MREWHEAHTGSARCCSICWRMVSDLPSLPCAIRSGTLAGGGGGGVPSSVSRIHFPRCTTEVRLGYEVTVSMLPCPSNPPRLGSVKVTFRNCGPYTLGTP